MTLELPVIKGDVGDTCLNNLKVCRASCCRVFEVKAECWVNSPLEQYLRTRGMTFKRMNREFIALRINHVCDHLTVENKCDLHGTDKKPQLCYMLTDKTVDRKLFMKTEGCVLGD